MNHERKRKPTSVGEILKEEYLIPLGLSQKKFSDHIGCDFKTINRIVNEKVSLTSEMAIKIASACNTTPEFWLNAQRATDLFYAIKRIKKLPKSLVA